jgi:hypothetical protein
MTERIPEPLAEALRLGTPLAVEVGASRPERLAGVTILPQRDDLDRLAQVEKWRHSSSSRTYVVLWREYSREHLEKGWDIAPDDGQWNVKLARVVGMDALENLLRTWGVPVEELTYLWKTAIPE